MAGATSLVQLILKKWGDDIAGAAKELEEKPNAMTRGMALLDVLPF